MTGDARFPASNALIEAQDSRSPVANYWLSEDGQTGPKQQFTMDLGVLRTVGEVRLINTHNHSYKDRATKRFRLGL